jgi:hypothetical protein
LSLGEVGPDVLVVDIVRTLSNFRGSEASVLDIPIIFNKELGGKQMNTYIGNSGDVGVSSSGRSGLSLLHRGSSLRHTLSLESVDGGSTVARQQGSFLSSLLATNVITLSQTSMRSKEIGVPLHERSQHR